MKPIGKSLLLFALAIPAYVTATLNGTSYTEETPLDIIHTFREAASIVKSKKAAFEGLMGRDAEFDALINDQIAWANLGDYYAYKFDGVLDLRFYNETRDEAKKVSAIEKLQAAIPLFEAYVTDMIARYVGNVRLSRAGIFSFSNVLEEVKADVSIAEKWTPRNL